ncbi:MAG: hypothetical protein EBZ24_08105, partial [Synechococcaceae bacterium WB9_4xB_025]|nr:hypothetical protein [Synechococcaceae bacterium WB9_4xB_025]
MHELQHKLQTEQPSMSAGDVADAAESERLNVTLPGGVMARRQRRHRHSWMVARFAACVAA